MLRVFQHWCSQRKLGLFVLEQAVLVGAALAGAFAAMGAEGKASPAVGLIVALTFAAAVQGGLYFGDLYDLRTALGDRARGGRLLRAVGLAAVGVGLLALLAPSLPRGSLLGAAVGAVAAVLGTRLAFPALVGRPTRVLVVGSGARARELGEVVRQADDLFEMAGFVDPGFEGGERGEGQQEGDPLEVAQRLGASLVVVAREERRGVIPVAALVRCRLAGVEVLDATAFAERALRRIPVRWIRPGDIAFADGFRASRLGEGCKRALDLAAALALSLAAAPIMVLAAILVRLDSRGPIFYSQERVGRDGRTFRLTKFRTMRPDAEKEGPQWASLQDDRVTRIGRFLRKTRMDELPQILAVLRGDMSFVGPRPERPFFVQKLKEQIPFYELREAVKPGITGWAQIRYPYGASVEDARHKLEFDLYYLKNRSVFLDLAIIFHTVRHVLFGRGAR